MCLPPEAPLRVTLPRGEKVTEGHSLTHLGQPRSLDEVIEFPQRCVPRQTLDVPEQVLGLGLKQPPGPGPGGKQSTTTTTMMTLYEQINGLINK